MTYSTEVMADSPYIYWRLGETIGTTATDASGNNKHGTYSGSYTLGAAGLIADANTAVSFTAGLVKVADAFDLTSLTFEAWYKGTDTDGTICGRDPGGFPVIARMWIHSGVAQLSVMNAGGTGAETNSTTPVNDNVAHHIAGTYGGGTLRIYQDGVQTGTATLAGPLVDTDIAFTAAGRDFSSGGPQYETGGVIDEVAYYRSALSAARILAHYTAGTGSPPKTGTSTGAYAWAGTATGLAPVAVGIYADEVLADNPTRYYHLDETSGGTADDASTANTDGSYINTPTLAVTGVVGTAVHTAVADLEYINMPITGLTTAWSLELWWKTGGMAGSVIWRDQTSSGGWLMLLANSDADLTVRANGNNRTITGAGTIVDDGSFHHIVMTSSGTQVKTYVDAVLKDTWTVTAAASTVFAALRFGRNGTVTSSGYDGTYDEIAVYPTVLSAARVTAHYLADKTVAPPTGTGTGGFAYAGTAVGSMPVPLTTVKQLATGLPMKISSAGSWIPVKVLT